MSETQVSPQIYLPQVCLADEINSALPLEHTLVNMQVTGPVASVIVSQRFGNPLKESAELDYLYPLPEDAAITGFDLRIGDRLIHGDLREHEAARAAYEDARGQGKRAGLFEQRRPNLFAVRLANVQAGETIQAELHYQQRLKFDEDAHSGSYELVFPMGLTPKYDRPQNPKEGEGVHAPVARMDEKIGPVEINLSVDAGLPVGDPTSPSHPIEAVRLDDRRFQAHLAGDQIPDHDFILRYPVLGTQVQAAGWSSGEPDKAYFLATLVPPVLEEEIEPLPREFIFILDRSGSMTGDPIRQARNALRACLRTLAPKDTFRILLFDNTLEWFQPEPAQAAQEQVQRADKYLDQVQGRGGTEIGMALKAALDLPQDAERVRFLIFLTDGAVSAESSILESIRKKIGTARLFTFGIGPSVNRALLNRMSALGRGRSAFLQLDEDIEGAIIRFQDSVSFPVLTDLTLEWENGQAWDIYPTRLPDLYYGQPLEICGRFGAGKTGPVRLTVRGLRAGEARHAGKANYADQAVLLRLTLPEPASTDAAIERVWARARVDDLLEKMEMAPDQADKLRAEVLGLALENHLVTPLTSFVAVDQQTTAGGQPHVLHVAQPLPQGLQAVGFGMGGQIHAAMAFTSGAALPGAMSAMASMPIQKMISENAPGDRPSARKRSSTREDRGELARGKAQIDNSRGEPGMPPELTVENPETLLRWFARTQNMDGSWKNDPEWTAVAVMIFLRAGQTPRTGTYRRALRRAAQWLGQYQGQGFAGFLCARSLKELADATGEDRDRLAAEAARQRLPDPSNSLERAASSLPVSAPTAIQTLDDLRLSALSGLNLPVPEALGQPGQQDLAWLWSSLK